MSKTKKAVIITAVISVIAGLVIGLGAITLIRFDLTELSTVEYVTNTYETTEPFKNIDIRCIQSNVRLVVSNELTTSRVVCRETESITHSVEVKDNTLVITSMDNREWYEHIGIFIGEISATVYLPQNVFQDLFVETTSGDIEIPDTLAFAEAELLTTSGNISYLAELGLDAIDGLTLTASSTSGRIILETKTIMDKLDVSTVSGDISIRNTSADSVSISTTSGRIEAYNLTAGRYDESISFIGGGADISSVSGNIELSSSMFGECSITTTSGNVRFDGVDSETYSITTVSGSVRGNIRSYKNFIANTVSGNIELPPSNPDEGLCEINTTSGDIDLEVIF